MTKADRALFEALLAAVQGGKTPVAPAPTATTYVAPASGPAQASALPLWAQEVLRKADLPPIPATVTVPIQVPQPQPEKKPEPPFATLAELVAYRAEHKAPPLQTPDRPWSFVGYDASGSDNLTVVFQAPQKNGGWFRSTLAIDLFNAIRKGTVAGMR